MAASGRPKRPSLPFVVASSGRQPTKPGRTVGELLDRCFDACCPDWSPGTAYETRWVIDRRLAGLRDRPLRALDTADFDEFYDVLRQRGGRAGASLAVSTVLRVRGVLRLALHQAVKWDGLVSIRPSLPDPPAHEAEDQPPTAEEVIQLLEAADRDDPELLTFLFLDAATGARRGELSALRLDDFGDDSVSISRALTVGLTTPENEERYKATSGSRAGQRGQLPTAVIQKANPKNQSSVRTIWGCLPAVLLCHQVIKEGRPERIGRSWPSSSDASPPGPSRGHLGAHLLSLSTRGTGQRDPNHRLPGAKRPGVSNVTVFAESY